MRFRCEIHRKTITAGRKYWAHSKSISPCFRIQMKYRIQELRIDLHNWKSRSEYTHTHTHAQTHTPTIKTETNEQVNKHVNRKIDCQKNFVFFSSFRWPALCSVDLVAFDKWNLSHARTFAHSQRRTICSVIFLMDKFTRQFQCLLLRWSLDESR